VRFNVIVEATRTAIAVADVIAPSETISTARSARLYQPVTMTRCQRVLGVGQTFAQAGLALSNDPRRTKGVGVTAHGRIKESSIDPPPGDHADVPLHRVEQIDGRLTAVGDGDDPAPRQPSRDMQ
jgi:hypothetical protein